MEHAELLDILRQFSISEYMQKTEIDTSRGSDYRLNLNVDQKYVVQSYDLSVLSETGSGKDASVSGVHPAMKPFAAAGPPSAPASFFAFAGVVVAADRSGLACLPLAGNSNCRSTGTKAPVVRRHYRDLARPPFAGVVAADHSGLACLQRPRLPTAASPARLLSAIQIAGAPGQRRLWSGATTVALPAHLLPG